VRTANLQTTRPAAAAGLFYPVRPRELRSEIDRMLSETEVPSEASSVSSLIVPHAGYVYSGRIAASAFAAIRGSEWDAVVVLSPNHRDYFEGVSLYPGNYETPLGTVTVASDLVMQLAEAEPRLQISRLGHQREHGIEVELPFLQVLLGEFRLVPIVMATQDMETCTVLSQALKTVLKGKRVLMVASSDLSHFHRQEEAHKLDGVAVQDVNRFDENRLYQDIRAGRTEACGYGPMIVTMMMARQAGCVSAEVLRYGTSGDVNGDHTEVVGYLGGVMREVTIGKSSTNSG